MKIYGITMRQNQLNQWKDTINSKYELIQLDQDELINELNSIEAKSIIIVDLVSCKKIFLNAIAEHRELFDSLHVVTLSNIPNIHECLGLLTFDIKAYGNNLMDESFFNEMLDKVRAGHMWFPELILEDVIRVALHSSNQPQKLNSLDILTPREQEVAFYVAQGKSNKEIAIVLELSADTVKLHLSHIYKKLYIDNRVSLALKLKV